MRDLPKKLFNQPTLKFFSAVLMVLWGLNSCGQDRLADLDFLIGTWKVEGKERYEVWERGGANLLSGTAYKIENGSEITLETLAIRVSGDRIVYEATVLNQNDGQTIPFTLTIDIDRSFVFENPEHDFPKKIIYQRMNNGELLVRVLGDDDQGFSMTFVRQSD